MNEESYQDLITVEELRETLAVGRNTAYSLLNNGEILYPKKMSGQLKKDCGYPVLFLICLKQSGNRI